MPQKRKKRGIFVFVRNRQIARNEHNEGGKICGMTHLLSDCVRLSRSRRWSRLRPRADLDSGRPGQSALSLLQLRSSRRSKCIKGNFHGTTSSLCYVVCNFLISLIHLFFYFLFTFLVFVLSFATFQFPSSICFSIFTIFTFGIPTIGCASPQYRSPCQLNMSGGSCK